MTRRAAAILIFVIASLTLVTLLFIAISLLWPQNIWIQTAIALGGTVLLVITF
ncbi:MAG: hypothetical protein R3C62_06955 [Chloroflexota bacterium]